MTKNDVQVPVSVLILTLNEEVNIARCLSSVQWCRDVVVLDSYSQDKTEEISRTFGVRFVERQFDDYASQRNYGINEVKYKNPWVLMIDADEVVTTELFEEIQEKLANKSSEQVCIFRVRTKNYFMGKWIKHSSGYPTWYGRLLRVGRVRAERSINEHFVTDGKVEFLNGHLDHFTFNKGFEAWFEKHNRYSSMEAEGMMKNETKIELFEFFHSDPAVRRKVIKSVVYRCPGRPIIMFVGLYILRGGFLDGTAGFRFCVLRSIYEYMIDCKVAELKRRAQHLPF